LWLFGLAARLEVPARKTGGRVLHLCHRPDLQSSRLHQRHNHRPATKTKTTPI